MDIVLNPSRISLIKTVQSQTASLSQKKDPTGWTDLTTFSALKKS
jgi:hypothetical protein